MKEAIRFKGAAPDDARAPIIVGEVSRNWSQEQGTERPTIAQMFEELIAVNTARGYELDSWQLVATPLLSVFGVLTLTETIVATFRLP